MNRYLRLFLCLSIPLTLGANEKKSVDHYLEANISGNYLFTGGDRLENDAFFALGLHIAHGSNITEVHSLVMSYGKDYIKQDDAVLTSAAFFLRRYMSKYTGSDFLPYTTIGSAYYRYKKSATAGVLENAGLIIGLGSDWVWSKKLRLSLEVDYRGFNIRQFAGNSVDYIRPFTIFAGLRYFYLTTKY